MYPIDNFSHGSFWHCIKSNRILNSIIYCTNYILQISISKYLKSESIYPKQYIEYIQNRERDNYAIYTLYLLYIFTYHLQLLNFNYAEPSSKKEKTVGFRNYYHTKLRNKKLRKTISKIL